MFTALIYVTGIKESLKLYQGPKYAYYYNHHNKESFAKMFYTGDHPYMGTNFYLFLHFDSNPHINFQTRYRIDW